MPALDAQDPSCFDELSQLRQRVIELESSEAQLRALVDTTSDWIWEVDAGIVYTYASPKVRDILGYKPEEVVGKTPFELMPPDEAERMRPIVAEIWAGGRPFAELENLNRRRDGNMVLLESSGVPIRGPGGEFLGFRGIDRDITKRKQIEREREWLFRLSIDMLCVAGFDGRLKQVNPAWTTTLGWTAEELTTRPWLDFVHPDDREATMAVGQRLLAGEAVYGFENRYQCRDGSWRWLSWNSFPVPGQGLMYGVVRDITERLRAEEEQRKFEAHLQQTQKLESLGVLAGGIAHDFNNLLTAILGHANLARVDLPQGSPACENLREIEIASGRAAELCRQMLAYAGRGQLVIEKVDLTQLIRDLLALLRVPASERALLHYQLADDLPLIEGDPVQIRQVIMNVVVNAFEAIGDADGVVHLSTRLAQCTTADLEGCPMIESPPPGRFVCVEVSDTGCGMDAATCAKIFEPFFSTKFTGRGLGLPAALGIMRKHGGTIRLKTTPGKGSTFRLFFPVAPIDPGADSAAAIPAGDARGG